MARIRVDSVLVGLEIDGVEATVEVRCLDRVTGEPSGRLRFDDPIDLGERASAVSQALPRVAQTLMEKAGELCRLGEQAG